VDDTRLWAHRRYESLLERARQVQAYAEKSPGRIGRMALGAIALAILLLNLGRLRRVARVRRLLRNPASAPQAAAGIWYARMLRSLGRRGWRKLPEHTPKEFVETIGDTKLRGPVEAFTEHYERARFGNSADDAQALSEIYEEIRKS